MASHDALTDLPNRVLFRQRLDEALSACHRGNGAVAVLMLDLNGFKDVNDTLGHPVGDALLAGVAERLQRAVRAEDTIARLGGDEFAIVVHTFDAAREAAAMSQRIQAALSQAFDVGEQQVAIGTSIGISVAAHGSGNADRMIKQADTALYRAKADGGNSYCFFEPSMDQEPGGRIPARRSRTA
jgi:diguanylate cyclase (GGDEF)-like protein